jgi:hypothetical protein
VIRSNVHSRSGAAVVRFVLGHATYEPHASDAFMCLCNGQANVDVATTIDESVMCSHDSVQR